MAVLQCCSPVLVANHCGAITEQHKALEAEAYMVYSMPCTYEVDLRPPHAQLNGRFMYAGLESLPYRTCTPLNIGLQYVTERLLEMSVEIDVATSDTH